MIPVVVKVNVMCATHRQAKMGWVKVPIERSGTDWIAWSPIASSNGATSEVAFVPAPIALDVPELFVDGDVPMDAVLSKRPPRSASKPGFGPTISGTVGDSGDFPVSALNFYCRLCGSRDGRPRHEEVRWHRFLHLLEPAVDDPGWTGGTVTLYL